MRTRILLLILISGMTLFLPGTSWADIPAPPANQNLGMPDVSFETLINPNDCIVCHTDVIPTEGAHHTTSLAQGGDCFTCHGGYVEDMDDGHDIPTYTPSLVTPSPSAGDGLPANSRGTFAGGCNYCHDDDGLTPPIILTNEELHHGTGFGSDATKCAWCHNDSLSSEEQIRTCEGCHGMDSLHNIQADSDNSGSVIIGGEYAGYGHVGNESDCWGCHGFAKVTSPSSNPDRHHNLYGETIPESTVAPYGTSGDPYGCLSCHGWSFTGFTVERECLACHTTWDPGSAEAVVDFFEDSVTNGRLQGVGPGMSANNKLNAFNNMLEKIVDLVEAGDITGACQQISDAMKKCDGATPPPDFVTGSDRAGLHSLLDGLWDTYGCPSP